MNKNIGNVDKVVRIVAGLGLLSLFFILEGNARWFGLIGVVLLSTMAVSWCPLYVMLGIKTNRGS